MNLLEYSFEKRPHLHSANSTLPDTSVVQLILHGVTRDCQRQVQGGTPVTVEDLVHALKDVCIDTAPPYSTTRVGRQSQNLYTMQARAKLYLAISVERSRMNLLASDDAAALDAQCRVTVIKKETYKTLLSWRNVTQSYGMSNKRLFPK